jgi:hypothetical protein
MPPDYQQDLIVKSHSPNIKKCSYSTTRTVITLAQSTMPHYGYVPGLAVHALGKVVNRYFRAVLLSVVFLHLAILRRLRQAVNTARATFTQLVMATVFAPITCVVKVRDADKKRYSK